MNIKKFIRIGIAVLFLTVFCQDMIEARSLRSKKASMQRKIKRGKKSGKNRGNLKKNRKRNQKGGRPKSFGTSATLSRFAASSKPLAKRKSSPAVRFKKASKPLAKRKSSPAARFKKASKPLAKRKSSPAARFKKASKPLAKRKSSPAVRFKKASTSSAKRKSSPAVRYKKASTSSAKRKSSPAVPFKVPTPLASSPVVPFKAPTPLASSPAAPFKASKPLAKRESLPAEPFKAPTPLVERKLLPAVPFEAPTPLASPPSALSRTTPKLPVAVPFTTSSNPLTFDWASRFDADCQEEIDYFTKNKMLLTDSQKVLNFVNGWSPQLSSSGLRTPLGLLRSSDYGNLHLKICGLMRENANFYIQQTVNIDQKDQPVHALRNLIASFINDWNDWLNYLNGNNKNRRNIKYYAPIFDKLWNLAGNVVKREWGVPGLKYLQIDAIDRAFEEYIKNPNSGPSQIYCRDGFMIENLENDQYETSRFPGDILRGRCVASTIASRFYGLEVSFAKDLKNSITDFTQGPGGTLQALSGLFVRSYAALYGQLMEGIVPVLQGLGGKGIPRMIANTHEIFRCSTAPRGKNWSINNHTARKMSGNIYKCTGSNFVLCSGYFCPGNVDNVNQLREIKNHVERNANKFALPVQIVMTEWRGMPQVQIFLAAPDQGKGMFCGESDCADICKALVVPQYRAAAELACMLGIPLFLTRVGQGVFTNSPEIMKAALGEVLEVAKSRNMLIYLDGKDWEKDLLTFFKKYKTNEFEYKGAFIND
ncbi:MAG: hypothetical protein LBI77_03560 [Puniceicoccales bacterium]|jgi:hypothetical protein|nr:hypothetical protein [Puniceicoccales bacterium]